MANWYAVYTRPRCEKKVIEAFSRRKWESYYPYTAVVHPGWGGRRTTGGKALFPGYVFVRLDEAQLAQVYKIEGVRTVVCWLNRPAVIRGVEIEMMQRFLSVHAVVHVERTAVSVGEMVQLSGASEGVGARARLLLPSLGYRLVAEGRTEHINVIEMAQQPLRAKHQTSLLKFAQSSSISK